MNILLVHNYYQIPGGEDTVVKNEKELLEANGCKVWLYTRNNSEIKDFSILQKLCLPITSIFSLKTYQEIRRILRDNHIEMVHVHNTLSLISPAVYYAAEKEHVPVIQTVHNYRLICPAATLYRKKGICTDCLEKGLGCAVMHKCYRASRIQSFVSACVLWIHRKSGIYRKINYICLTDFNRRKLLEAKKHGNTLFHAAKMYVKPNFTAPVKAYKPYGERENYFIYVGRLDSLKGIRLLLKRWRNIQERLVVCGTGPEESWCREFCAENRMEQVELKGQLSHDEIMKLIGNARALIFPTQWYEGQPMTIVESFSVGTPVIGTELGNVEEMIEEGKTGLHVDVALESLSDKLNELKPEMSDACLREYERKYTPQVNFKAFTRIWSDIQRNSI
ncbi:MAG: glycosyltransferase family 4 protein [Clostridiales bacterium]|nr:glycosyltransferase family 4 protein [Clostridiales bacterium]